MTQRPIAEIVGEFKGLRGQRHLRHDYEKGYTEANLWVEHVLTQDRSQADERLREVVEEVIEIIESVQLIATKKHANDTTPEKAKIVNEWLMPEVKRNIIEAVKTIDITPNTPQV